MNIIHRSDTHDTEAVEYTADHVSEVDDKFPISGDLPLPLISIIKNAIIYLMIYCEISPLINVKILNKVKYSYILKHR